METRNVSQKRKIRRPVLNLVMQKFIPSEYQECKAFYQYLIRIRADEDLIKHANERKDEDGGWFIKALKAIGFKKGIPDYQYIVSNGKYHTLWIEMKRRSERDKKKRPEQDAWLSKLNSRGHYATYAYGCEEAIKIFTMYKDNLL